MTPRAIGHLPFHNHRRFAARLEVDGSGTLTMYRGADGQVAHVFSGPDETEMHRVMAEHLRERGWIVVAPGWFARALRRFVIRSLGL